MTATLPPIAARTPAMSPVVLRREPFPALRQRPTPTETFYSVISETQEETYVVLQPWLSSPICNPRSALEEALEKIYGLLQPTDSRDFPAHPLAAENAAQWLEMLHDDIAAQGLEWREPMVSSEPEGNIVLEWWRGDRKLVVYIAPDTIEYIKAWGPSMLHEMEDGYVVNHSDGRLLWRWLLDENSPT